MLITASVRPKGLKRGVTCKAWCKAIGFKEEVGLHETCGRLELSAAGPQDAAFLHSLNQCFAWGDNYAVIFDKSGKEIARTVSEEMPHAK